MLSAKPSWISIWNNFLRKKVLTLWYSLETKCCKVKSKVLRLIDFWEIPNWRSKYNIKEKSKHYFQLICLYKDYICNVGDAKCCSCSDWFGLTNSIIQSRTEFDSFTLLPIKNSKMNKSPNPIQSNPIHRDWRSSYQMRRNFPRRRAVNSSLARDIYYLTKLNFINPIIGFHHFLMLCKQKMMISNMYKGFISTASILYQWQLNQSFMLIDGACI